MKQEIAKSKQIILGKKKKRNKIQQHYCKNNIACPLYKLRKKNYFPFCEI